MKLTRRNLMQFSAASAAALAVGRGSALAALNPTDEIRDNAVRFFGELGFAEKPPLDMITGTAFNGGLRYDETSPNAPAVPLITVQSAARVEDIAARGQPGVLANFTIFGIGLPGPARPDAILSPVMGFLVHERKLDPERMLFVSTERFRPLVDQVEGVVAERVIERSIEEAMAAGDGSGFFAPAGHPEAPQLDTVGIYYPMPDANVSADRSYPPAGYLEIAEIGLAPLGDDPDGAQIGGFGLERVAMAEGETVSDFEEPPQPSAYHRRRGAAKRQGLPPAHDVCLVVTRRAVEGTNG